MGARSGAERVTPVMGIREGDTWLIAASKAGADDNPAWYHNLVAHPEVEIETPDDGVVAVHATVLAGAERDAAWERFTAAAPGFRSYREAHEPRHPGGEADPSRLTPPRRR
ncbi:nitroreductase family deazaflavin-dependent oxidoreductase [Microbacterium elymi]|uniref:Nitroreductase family deazaflavin-dependent oxidoreductase n=1 Tax=Microbacterium elymi TaxID=2909587 RepID=A0ABY5NN32_9MICO|nr:nitroreductase family deazaflavin-dependent oxidoreductase [Microbacterium elymi]UUT36583.1 nitroreductase family deazaflavin-dependent oxidoreductase [Microbacterium elymi]